jgi:DNA-binding NarL/FixJ family response regulator
MNEPLRILIADDHEVVRAGLRALLESVPGWTVCAEAGDGRTALQLVRELLPHVAIIDIGMRQMNGLDATRAIGKACPQVQVLILSMHDTDQHVTEALAAGASGYVIKADAGKELIRAVEALGHEQPFFSSGVAATVARSGWAPHSPRAPKKTPSALTQREREIVQLLAEGKNNRETGELLKISVKTVETHRARIMSKLRLNSFAEMVLYAVRNHIVNP